IEIGLSLALAQRHLELEGAVEMILDDALVAPGNENEMLDAGLPCFVDDMLDDGPVDNREHFLGHGLGGGQESGPQTGNGEDGFADSFHTACFMTRLLDEGRGGRCQGNARQDGSVPGVVNGPATIYVPHSKGYPPIRHRLNT